MKLWGGSKKSRFEGAHVLITGGTAGIGQCLAKEFLKLRANVTILARSRDKLESTTEELRELKKLHGLQGKVHAVAADVSDFTQVKAAVEEAERMLGTLYCAVSCAGFCTPGRFVDQDVGIHEKSFQVNYFGTLYLVHAVIPGMVQRGDGVVLLVASPLAETGMSGYATYCPAKSAVRGLADTLRNELAGSNVQISVGYPLDTDTEGYAQELLTKPPEAEAISKFAAGPLVSAESVAKGMIQGLEKGSYRIKTSDFIVNLLLTSMSSTSPRLYPVILEMLLAPLIVVLSCIYYKIMDKFVIDQRKKERAAVAESTASVKASSRGTGKKA